MLVEYISALPWSVTSPYTSAYLEVNNLKSALCSPLIFFLHALQLFGVGPCLMVVIRHSNEPTQDRKLIKLRPAVPRFFRIKYI